jgi:hypothetical protein
MKNVALHYDYRGDFDVNARTEVYKDGKPYIVVNVSDNEGYLSLFINREQAEKIRDTLSAVIEQYEEVKA